MKLTIFLLATTSSVSHAFLQATTGSSLLRPRSHSLRSMQLRSTATSTAAVLQPPPSTHNDKEAAATSSESHTNDDDKFDWFKAWHPLVPVDILNVEEPHKFELLGMPLVVWKADSPMIGMEHDSGPKPKRGKRDPTVGEWRAFTDSCPHRKVPLSEGRIEADGSLLCSYHGWRFDGQGDLINVPQMDSNELMNVKSNPKSQCNAFPVQVVDGVLWVWPETGSDARLESALTPVKHYTLPGDRKKEDAWYGPWNYRELPYGADFFLENVVDGAHVAVSHHGIVGSRYGNLVFDSMKRTTPLTKDGFAVTTKMSAQSGQSSTTFQAPGHVAIEAAAENGALQTLELYTSPSRPGFCNHIGRMVMIKDKNGKMPKLLRQFTLPLPMWVNHMMASLFLNQDALFLHHQERHLSQSGAYSSLKNEPNDSADHYTKAVLPVGTDVGVVNLRNWLRVFAGGRIPYKYNPSMPDANNDIVFDVWNGHTKYCHACQTALKNIKKARLVSFAVATCLAVLRPAASKALNLAGVLATAGLGLVLNKVVGMFYRYEFSHAHND